MPLTIQQQSLLQLMDIPLWLPRSAPLSAIDWPRLDNQVKTCQACELCQHRTHAVLGAGNRQAKLVLVGEGPGEQEDREGVPFVGRAGQLLTQILASIGLSREDIYICNIVKCRPPKNRTPEPLEIQACFPFLQAQFELIQPQWVVALGLTAAQALLKVNQPLKSLREKVFTLPDSSLPLRVTYHPAYLLRRPEDKAKAYQDWLAIQDWINHD